MDITSYFYKISWNIHLSDSRETLGILVERVILNLFSFFFPATISSLIKSDFESKSGYSFPKNSYL